ncbi:alpha/beta-hydrolase family protein [Ornithinimicrobium murale]|uniref:alpha/beta-hydrolase family protein n=1 Tax=Ornithinimicrobium murale TaxID=1050153 RepID=UPI000E0D1172|nr:alpha/beta-hydrolase family protein [Ornithinimicrobium murale]
MLTRTSLKPPRVGTTLTVGAALTLSTVPSLLPRAPLTQGLLSGGLVLLSLVVLAAGRLVLRRLGRATSPTTPRARWLVLVGTGTAVAGTAWLAQLGLGQWAADLAMPLPGPAYWLSAGAWTVLVVALGVVVTAGIRRMVRTTGRRTRKPLAAALLASVTVTSAAAGPVDLLKPLRKDLGAGHVLLIDSPAGASRSFVEVDEAATPQEGAELAVDRLVADGGLEREAILIALPTGSGWVNREAITAFESQLDGDVAVVSAQYGDLPSWWSFLLDQDPASHSAEGLVDGVLDRVADLPVEQRPDVYVHGESLGAVAGQAAVADVEPDALCGVIWSGAPGGALSGHPRERSLRNADDPVTYLSSDLVLEQPEGWPTAWLPGLSYGTTVLDLASSLLPDAGHGHMYGPEQDWTLPSC